MQFDWRAISGPALTTATALPVTAAACTAGWLTLNEFSKCFSKGIGGPGCFGPGNLIVQAVEHAISDIIKGPGENNEVVKALRDVGIEFKDVTWSTPLGRGDAFIPKAGRDINRAWNCIWGC